MTFTPARLEDVTLERDEMVAAGFLVRYREPTRTHYTRNLKQWFEWCQQRGVAPLKAKRAHIEVYARELEELRGLKVSSVANKLNTTLDQVMLPYMHGELGHTVYELYRDQQLALPPGDE